MKYYYDLHIHSALSPCGNKDMTPNNIVNMALLKGLDIISITDHNTMLNNISATEVGKDKGILVIPGIEVTTLEEVHVLCYFDDLEKGIEFSNIVYEGLLNIKNNEKIFGEQIILDEKDKKVGKLDKLLLSSTRYSIEEVYKLTKEHGGVMVPAHINKPSYSILSVLGFVPDNIFISSLEIFKKRDLNLFDDTLPLKDYNFLYNSDAHYLEDIMERINFLELDKRNVKSVIQYIKKDEGL